MSEKFRLPLRFDVQVEERLDAPARRRWHAQFRFYPLGYFRGQGDCPGAALARAWGQFRRAVDPGRRWWTSVQGPGSPVVRY